MGEEAAAVNRLEGLPQTYDPDALHATLERALRSAVWPPPASPSGTGQWRLPKYNETKTLAITYPFEGGTYGATNDPRIARVSSVQGKGMVEGSALQRFRVKAGVALVPFIIAPVSHAATSPRQVSFGRIVTGIPHDLGTIPEFLVAQTSADEKGPTAGVLTISGGTANTLFTGYANGESLRADISLLPILGRTPSDIMRAMYPLFQFWDGSSSVGSFNLGLQGAPVGPAVKYFESTNLAQAIASEMVTTDKTFAAVILATNWGIGTFQAGHGYYSGAAMTVEDITAKVVDSVQGHEEAMASCLLPISRSPYLLIVNNWTGTITCQNIYDDGLRVLLGEGSLDFIMG